MWIPPTRNHLAPASPQLPELSWPIWKQWWMFPQRIGWTERTRSPVALQIPWKEFCKTLWASLFQNLWSSLSMTCQIVTVMQKHPMERFVASTSQMAGVTTPMSLMANAEQVWRSTRRSTLIRLPQCCASTLANFQLCLSLNPILYQTSLPTRTIFDVAILPPWVLTSGVSVMLWRPWLLLTRMQPSIWMRVTVDGWAGRTTWETMWEQFVLLMLQIISVALHPMLQAISTWAKPVALMITAWVVSTMMMSAVRTLVGWSASGTLHRTSSTMPSTCGRQCPRAFLGSFRTWSSTPAVMEWPAWGLNGAGGCQLGCLLSCSTSSYYTIMNIYGNRFLETHLIRSGLVQPHADIFSVQRSQCKNWCNVRNAGVGHVASTATDVPDVVDAYFWLKTPGESDGCTQILPDGATCPRFDADCASQDSLGSWPGEPRAPEAGQWFDYQVKQLAGFAELSRG